MLNVAPIRVLVVSESLLHREGLALRLSVEPGIRAVGAAENINAALPLIADHDVDVVVVDATATPENLVELASAVRADLGVHFVSLAMVGSDTDIVAWAEAGTSAIVDRNGSPLELRTAMEAMMRGEVQCSPRVAGALLRRVRTLAGGVRRTNDTARLTDRERDILTLIGEGMSNQEIARRLGLQVPTVKNHVHSIYEKLGITGRAKAVSLALSLRPPARTGLAPDALSD
jgi:two-component system nitrate/nitrite response regulator NarL